MHRVLSSLPFVSGLTTLHIKVIAVTAMLIDHFALLYFPDSLPLIIIGRISFPLIAWLIANGARHTHDIDAYLMRLLIFAGISQIPYEMGFYLSGWPPFSMLNVLVTLALGLLAIRFIERRETTALRVLGPIACAMAALYLDTDYGAAGVLSIVAFHLFFNRFTLMAIAQTCILLVGPLLVYYLQRHLPFSFSPYYLTNPAEGWALLALPLIALYNGARGAKWQYLFYWIFPLQALLILVLKAWR